MNTYCHSGVKTANVLCGGKCFCICNARDIRVGVGEATSNPHRLICIILALFLTKVEWKIWRPPVHFFN
jgi:hypothetical protein